MILKADFVSDWIEILKNVLSNDWGYNIVGIKNDDVPLVYYNTELRRIKPIKRVIKIADIFDCPVDLEKSWKAFKEKVENGEDVNLHLSTTINNLNFKDAMLTDWGIHHFHLVEKPRINNILFALVSEDSFYAINIFTHQDWAKYEVVEIVHRNWPEVIKRYKVNAVDIEFNVSEEGRKVIRKTNWEANYNLNLLANDANSDGDNDGLPNLQEYQNGTNPNNNDSDTDGMPDGWEVNNSLNPLLNNSSTDSDNDGLSDLQEYQSGTNPKTVDSDNDGISDGYEVAYGLSPLDPNDAAADADNDGYSNLREFLHNSEANDVNSLPTATILNVPQSCSSIQMAINLSIDGDTIKVARGRYYEVINFNGKAIKLTSSDPNNWYIVGTK